MVLVLKLIPLVFLCQIILTIKKVDTNFNSKVLSMMLMFPPILKGYLKIDFLKCFGNWMVEELTTIYVGRLLDTKCNRYEQRKCHRIRHAQFK